MKKNLLLLLVSLLVILQTIHAQTNPALLTNFTIKDDVRSGCRLSWAIANNEVINNFELQRSLDGREYTTVAVLFASAKRGTENYAHSEPVNTTGKVMYRLKMLNKGFDTYYSTVLIYNAKQASDSEVRIMGNPVTNKLSLSFGKSYSESVDIKVYNMSGVIVLNSKINRVDRNNTITIPLNPAMNPGMYVAEINDGVKNQALRFVKQ